MTDYLLGHSDEEWRRLDDQHELWAPGLLRVIDDLDLPDEPFLVEVGCGNGALLADLAKRGHVVGVERDAAAAAAAHARTGKRVIEGDLFDVVLPAADLVVARWVFSFLPRPAAAVERLAGALAPGGFLVVQDYDHDALGVWPRHPAIDATVEAFRAAYRARGGDLWVGPKLPAMMCGAGLEVAGVHPEVLAGGVGSPAWSWVERFLFGHVHTVVDDGHLDAAGVAAFEAAWRDARATPGATLVTPLQLTVVGQRVVS